MQQQYYSETHKGREKNKGRVNPLFLKSNWTSKIPCMGILQVSVLLVIVKEEQGRCSRGRQSNCSALVCQGHDGAVLADRSAGRFGRQAWRTDLWWHEEWWSEARVLCVLAPQDVLGVLESTAGGLFKIIFWGRRMLPYQSRFVEENPWFNS